MAILIGEDCRFQIESDTPGTYLTATELVEIECPDVENEAVEIGDLSVTSRRKRASRIKDNGEFVVRVNRDDADLVQIELRALSDSPPHPGSEPTFRVVYNNGSDTTRPHDEFSGFVSNYKKGDISENENVVDEYTITVTGTISTGTTTLP